MGDLPRRALTRKLRTLIGMLGCWLVVTFPLEYKHGEVAVKVSDCVSRNNGILLKSVNRHVAIEEPSNITNAHGSVSR